MKRGNLRISFLRPAILKTIQHSKLLIVNISVSSTNIEKYFSLTDLCLSRKQLPRPLFGLIEEARVLLLLQKPYQGKHPTYKYVHKWTHNKFQMTYICTYRFKLLNKCPPAATLSRQTSHIFYQLDFNFWTPRTEI